MTKAKSYQHVVDVTWLVDAFSFQYSEELLVVKVNICYISRDRCFHGIITISFFSDNHILKTHIISCESPSFIRKDMLYLAKFFIEWACLNANLSWFFSEIGITTDIDSLDVFDHLKSDYQRYRDEISKEKDPSTPFDKQFLWDRDEMTVL